MNELYSATSFGGQYGSDSDSDIDPWIYILIAIIVCCLSSSIGLGVTYALTRKKEGDDEEDFI